MKKTFINWVGLLGIISLLSYTAAVVCAPSAYPGYDWKSQAVSDLSAADAPSLALWNQLSSLYGLCGIVCVTMVCVFIAGKLNKSIRIGIYFFAGMEWVSGVGYAAFPLATSGFAGTFQDIMHALVTGLVVLLSIASLIAIMIGGYRRKQYTSLSIWATGALILMFVGAIGVATAPAEIFGIFERFSVFSAAAFNAVLGVYLLRGYDGFVMNNPASQTGQTRMERQIS